MNIPELYEVYKNHPVISTDTRKISDSCLFFALRGENFDANQFASTALDKGASYAIIDNAEFAVNDRYIVVDNVLTCLQQLAAYQRSTLTIPVIGITGTNGKTTTKELIRSVLAQHFKTFATEGNLNNHIGVPLTLLSITPEYEMAIVEMGANHQKEIEFLCSIAQPGYGLITNVGKAHLEGFGGLSGVRTAKGELYDFLQQTNGTVFVNTDNPILMEMINERSLTKVVGYGSHEENYISASLTSTFPTLSVSWRASNSTSYFTAESQLPGTYNFENILAAITIGHSFGMNPEEINRGIASYQPRNNRSQVLKTGKNTVICDYYNANPSSMAVALDNLASIDAAHKVMILGDMFELGQDSAMEHQFLVKKALTVQADRRIFVGQEFFRLREMQGGEFYQETVQAAEALRNGAPENSTILLKGSRGMKMESLLDLL